MAHEIRHELQLQVEHAEQINGYIVFTPQEGSLLMAYVKKLERQIESLERIGAELMRDTKKQC